MCASQKTHQRSLLLVLVLRRLLVLVLRRLLILIRRLLRLLLLLLVFVCRRLVGRRCGLLLRGGLLSVWSDSCVRAPSAIHTTYRLLGHSGCDLVDLVRLGRRRRDWLLHAFLLRGSSFLCGNDLLHFRLVAARQYRHTYAHTLRRTSSSSASLSCATGGGGGFFFAAGTALTVYK